MIRDDKGRFSSRPAKEMTEEQKNSICYKSKLLNKYFDNFDDLKEAERVFKEKEEEKNNLLAQKSKLAKEVEEAYKNALNVRKKASEDIKAADEKYYAARNNFIDKYGSFHMTYTNDSKNEQVNVTSWYDFLNKLFNW